MHVEIPNEEPVVIMTRTFAAPRDVVWTAFTDPRHVSKWYGGHGFDNPVCEMDVRPGGLWRHTMRTPDGTEFPMEFVYLEVVRPERLVWKNARPVTDPTRGKNVTNIVTLEDAGAQTKWKLVARFDSLAERDHAMGMGFSRVITQGSEKLDAIVRALAGGVQQPTA
jgi:uncharacterized protein YndB with AHSA1/START domain